MSAKVEQEQGHTPGPWTVHQRQGGLYTSPQPEIRSGVTSIADIRWNGHNEKCGQANAALIAAAPEMLATLKRIERQWHSYQNIGETAWYDMQRAIDAGRAIIIQAEEGRS